MKTHIVEIIPKIYSNESGGYGNRIVYMKAIQEIDKEIAKQLVLTKQDFIHLDYGKDYNIGLFYKENSKKTEIVTYGFGYDYRKYNPITLCKESFRAGIHFKEVETILYNALNNSIVSNHLTTHSFYINNQFTISNVSIPSITTDTHHTIIYENGEIKQKEFEKVMMEINNFVCDHFFPFFNEIQTLEDINNKILDKEDWKDWSNYIFGKAYFKAMIILKVVGNEEGYEKFTNMYIPRIEEGIKSRREDLKEYLADIKKLDQYLESGVYKDLLKE